MLLVLLLVLLLQMLPLLHWVVVGDLEEGVRQQEEGGVVGVAGEGAGVGEGKEGMRVVLGGELVREGVAGVVAVLHTRSSTSQQWATITGRTEPCRSRARACFKVAAVF
jgi:hypothetical protein